MRKAVHLQALGPGDYASALVTVACVNISSLKGPELVGNVEMEKKKKV